MVVKSGKELDEPSSCYSPPSQVQRTSSQDAHSSLFSLWANSQGTGASPIVGTTTPPRSENRLDLQEKGSTASPPTPTVAAWKEPPQVGVSPVSASESGMGSSPASSASRRLYYTNNNNSNNSNQQQYQAPQGASSLYRSGIHHVSY